jgi:cysteine synthase B
VFFRLAIELIQDLAGMTPLVGLERLPGDSSCRILVKLEGSNPSGSTKDRIVRNMMQQAEQRGEISYGDTLIEATSGNTGIALAMAASRKGYRVILIVPDEISEEMRIIMAGFGADLMPAPGPSGMERARDLAKELEQQGVGRVLDQFANEDNPLAHYQTTGPELWKDSDGTVTHFISCMGTTGTIVGVSKYLKEQNPLIQTIGVQTIEGYQIPGMQSWSPHYLPLIYEPNLVDDVVEISPELADETARRLSQEEGIFAGISSGAAVAAALRIGRRVENSVIATIAYDRGERYLSTGLYD